VPKIMVIAASTPAMTVRSVVIFQGPVVVLLEGSVNFSKLAAPYVGTDALDTAKKNRKNLHDDAWRVK
jgi:hypothetical protein